MKKILIIADGILAKHFLERVVNLHSDNNEYVIVVYRKRTLPADIDQKNFIIHTFDPTSVEKMSKVMNQEFDRVIVVVSKRIDLVGSYKSIRSFQPKVPVCLVDRWDVDIEDKYMTSINSKELLSSRIVDYLPNTPIFAHNVGLGMGEVMEVRVPIGSSYAYRHLGSIEQKKWRIACIYRNNSIILPKPNLMVQPNDLLLIVGEPIILQDVYKSIKKELGQFPLPFGSNIYVFIDMLSMDSERIKHILDDTFKLHEKLNSKKLHIRVANPTNSPLLDGIREKEDEDVELDIEYYDMNIEEIFFQDLKKNNIGLCVVDQQFFDANAKMLYKSKTPIFKLGVWGLERLKKGIVLGINLEDSEKDSSVIFDLSSQLNLQIELYMFNPEKDEEKIILAEHFENTAKLYSKHIEIIQKTDKNPVLEFKKQYDVLQFVPFYEDSIKSKILSVFSTDMNNLHFMLSDKYQLFLPTLE